MAFSSVVNLGAAPSGGYLVAQPVSTVETAAANPTATVLRPMSTTAGATIDGASLVGLTALMSGLFASGGGSARIITGTALPSLPVGTEYVWNQTDGAGNLVDIITGVA